ncbi:GNAT family N-acetyltransferase [Lysinibacillus sp. KU-BSD001]|uniref:GNAT family N-acetyltransferase n=1 Tax=Lysinibacillus sp. KU-BSD001 TaxID=3141328 RepID=UPI0036F01CB7
MKKLENKLITLIPISREHVDGIYKAAQDKRIWEHLSVDLTEREQVVAYVQEAVEKREAGTDFAFVMVEKASGNIVGCTWFLDISREHKRLEIGATWITPAYWRTAVNTNCKYVLLQYCFEKLQFNRVQIKTGHENIRSQRAIERIGATKEGVLRNHMIRKEGTIRHTVMYSITKEEWPHVKKHFEEKLL